MGFSWAETLGANTTKEKYTHLTELRSNIDTVRAQVALSGYSWTSTSQNSTEVVSVWSELKTAVDAAKNNTYCHTNYSSNYSGNCPSNYAYCSGNYANNGNCGANYGACGCK